MNTVKVQISRAEDNYCAMVDGLDCVLSTGETLEEIKKNILDGLAAFIETSKELGTEIPIELQGEYQLEYYLNLQSFLAFYKGVFSKSGLERLTGINQKQLWHYASGQKQPRKEQRERFEKAIHQLGEDLIAFHF